MNWLLYGIGVLCSLVAFPALTDGTRNYQDTEGQNWLLMATVWFCSGAIVGAINGSVRKQVSVPETGSSSPPLVEIPKKRRTLKDLTYAEMVTGIVIMVFWGYVVFWLIRTFQK